MIKEIYTRKENKGNLIIQNSRNKKDRRKIA